MNTLLILIIAIPVIEIYLFIKIGSQIGALTTISLIFFTAFVGVLYARYEGFNTLKSGMSQIIKNELPIYETDTLGLLIIFPPTRKFLLKNVSKNYSKKVKEKQNFIDGEAEDIEEDNDRKI